MPIDCLLRGLGRPHREGHRRRRGAWGRPRGLGGAWPWGGEGGVLNAIKDKFLKYKEKTQMRELPNNQYLTCDLPCIFTFLPKT